MGKKAYLLLGLLGLIWGSSFLFIKLGVNEMPPSFVAGGRLAAGTLLLLIALRLQGLHLPRRDLLIPLIVVAVLNNTIPWILIPWGEERISSALASILNATMPFFTVMIAHVATRDDRLTWPKLTGILIGFVGVAVLIRADLHDVTGASILGDLAVLAASLSYGAGAVYARQHLRGEDHTVLATGQLGLALLVTTPFMLFSLGDLQAIPSAAALVAVAALGFLGSGVAYIIYYWLIERVSASQVSLVTYLLPITAVFWGAALLNESLSLNTFAGLLLIFLGVFLVNSATPAVARVEASDR